MKSDDDYELTYCKFDAKYSTELIRIHENKLYKENEKKALEDVLKDRNLDINNLSEYNEKKTSDNHAYDKKIYDLEIKAWVPNKVLSIGEGIARIGTTNKSTLLRDATIVFDAKVLKLYCSHLFEKEEVVLAEHLYKDIQNIKYRKKSITRNQQLIQPILSGIFSAIGVSAFIMGYSWFVEKKHPDYEAIFMITIILSIFISGVIITGNSNQISPGDLSVFYIETNNGDNFEFSIEDKNVDSFLEYTRKNNITDEILS